MKRVAAAPFRTLTEKRLPSSTGKAAGTRSPSWPIWTKSSAGAWFELAVAGWNVAIQSVLFVGDDPTSDIAGARQVGMQTAQVGNGGDVESVLSLTEWLDKRTR